MAKFNPAKNLIQRYSELDRTAQGEVVEHVLGIAHETAQEASKQYEMVGMFEMIEEIQDARKNFGKMEGMGTGYPHIDKMTMGIAPGEMTVIGGATSNGKTLLAVNMAAKLAMSGRSVLFVTLEMTHREIGNRFSQVMGSKWIEHSTNIYFQKTDEMNWTSIDGLMKKAKEDIHADIVIIDHLHYFTRELQNVAEDLGRITKEFKKNAIRHNLPVILISHTRKGEGSSSSKTGINDLRGSSYIAQDADIVLMVHQDKIKNPGYTTVSLQKNRNRYGVDVGMAYDLQTDGLLLSENSYNDFYSPEEKEKTKDSWRAKMGPVPR